MKWFAFAGLPSDLLSGIRSGFRRLKTETSSTCFDEGRSHRLVYEYDIGSTPVVLKFDAAVNFKLVAQSLSCDQGAVIFKAYREGSEAGTFTPLTTFNNNLCEAQPSNVEVSTGGTFTPASEASDVIRLRTAGATAQRSNVGNGIGQPRRLLAGTYYLVLAREGGTDARGVYRIEWEECEA